MSDIAVTLSTNAIVDRLRKLHSDLTDENRHTDALLIDLAIQALRADATCFDHRVVCIVNAGLRAGAFDIAASDMVRRLSVQASPAKNGRGGRA